MASPPGAASSPGGSTGLVVHEWGTFSSFSGSDGTLLRFHPENTDLPPFVHRGGARLKQAYSGIVSLETPVVYFYADRPVTAEVQAAFPAGVFTEWFPQAVRPANGKALTWPAVRVRPGETGPLPAAPGASHYYAAREVDAAPLEVVTQKDGREVREREQFLFYRGVGDLRPPLAVTALGSGSFTLRATGDEPIPGLVLVEAKAGAVRCRQLSPLAAGASVEANLPTAWSAPDSLRAALVAMLVKAGLFEREARAMVKTWESAWFGDEGARVLYVLPAGWTERSLPLRVTPQPEALVRVLVGRHDILTPERERAIDSIVRQLGGSSAAERDAAARALAKLGRFGPPARKQSEERLARQR
jgi:hypothetical protein